MHKITPIFCLMLFSIFSIFCFQSAVAYSSTRLATTDLTLTLNEPVAGLGFNITGFSVLDFHPTRAFALKNNQYQFTCDAKFNLTIGFFADFSRQKVWQFRNPTNYQQYFLYDTASHERGYGYYYASFMTSEIQNKKPVGISIPGIPSDYANTMLYSYYDTVAMPLDINYLGPKNIQQIIAFQMAINPRNLKLSSEYFNSTTSAMQSAIRSSKLLSYSVKTITYTDLILNNSVTAIKPYIDRSSATQPPQATAPYEALTLYDHDYFLPDTLGLHWVQNSSVELQKAMYGMDQDQSTQENDSILLHLDLKPKVSVNYEHYRTRHISSGPLIYYEDRADARNWLGNPQYRPNEVCDTSRLYVLDEADCSRLVSYSIESPYLEAQFEVNAQLWAMASCKTNDTYTIDSLNNAFWTSLLTGQANGLVKDTNRPIGQVNSSTIDGYSVFYLIVVGMFVFYLLFKKYHQVN